MKLIVTPEMEAKWEQINARREADGNPPLNFRLFVKVRDRIDAIPGSYYQGDWVETNVESPCGVAACLAGETIICLAPSVADGVARLRELARTPERYKGHAVSGLSIVSEAATALGLSGTFDGVLHGDTSMETSIFQGSPRAWPARFREMYYALSHEGQVESQWAQAAVAYLDHIISTGNVLEQPST